MPIKVTASEDGEHVEIVLTGRIESAEYLEFFRATIRAATTAPRFRTTLFDCAGADTRGLTAEAVREVAELAADESVRLPGPRRLAVVASDSLTYGLARQWDLFTNDPAQRMEIFTGRDDARAWLTMQREMAGFEDDTRSVGGA